MYKAVSQSYVTSGFDGFKKIEENNFIVNRDAELSV